MKGRVLLIVGLLALLAIAHTPGVAAADRAVVVEMRNIMFFPDVIRVDRGDAVTIRVFNNDTEPHTFDLPEYNVHIGTRASELMPGQQGNATFVANQDGTFWYYCDVPGHSFQSADGSWSGMAGRLIVGQDGDQPPADLTPVIIGGVVAAVVAAVIILYFVRRKA